ncbi:MAG: bifunctional diaminohydroxyphosphoribosylaminopyrimidine deaminase/5-amino-6-(5-phosphoribosylamino)uracil reductase RibD [Proteobacteria bacterium]|nr:bifunctional diaminohydroxyphosphoribosylaminopyrimidine deaminase/5-amino-6-(5-phosphoribosylamino)uracil reductase RibD [Pseudomonadota bacterium]
MQRALALAEKGLYTATPNPRVGCVLVKGEKVVGEGWHEKVGGPHAEARALVQASAGAKGATAYITLEPCNHYGKTPPCAEAVIKAGLLRVVAAMRDPNPQSKKGGDAISAAGIAFESGLMEEEARELNIGFVSRMTRGRPWVRMKIAASLDGRTALANGKSQWITGAEARKDGHRWRARACAIATGAGTVRADDPRLTVRDVETPRQPLRVVIDSHVETPPQARVLQGEKALVFAAVSGKNLPNAEIVVLPDAGGKVDLKKMLEELARRGVNELHVEGGFKLNGSLVRAGCVDEFLIYLNPSLLGDSAQGMVNLQEMTGLDQRIALKLRSVDRIGDDLRLVARLA